MLNPIETAFLKIKNNIRSRLRQGAADLLLKLIYSTTESNTESDCGCYCSLVAQNNV